SFSEFYSFTAAGELWDGTLQARGDLARAWRVIPPFFPAHPPRSFGTIRKNRQNPSLHHDAGTASPPAMVARAASTSTDTPSFTCRTEPSTRASDADALTPPKFQLDRLRSRPKAESWPISGASSAS